MFETYWQAQECYPSTSSSEGNRSSSDLPVNSRAMRPVAGDDNEVYKYAPDIQEVLQEAQKPQKVAEGRPWTDSRWSHPVVASPQARQQGQALQDIDGQRDTIHCIYFGSRQCNEVADQLARVCSSNQ
jgi:hypothetical protein